MDPAAEYSPCAEGTRLAAAVDEILRHLVELTRTQREVFQRRDDAEFARLDRELEQTVGEKERRVGALNQHRKDHRCQ